MIERATRVARMARYGRTEPTATRGMPSGGGSGDCSGFTYQPANYGSGDSWPAPAPYPTSLDAFDGEVANGTWRLYVVDDVQPNSGDIEGGWSLSMDTGPVDAAIPGNGTSGPASVYPATRTVSGQDSCSQLRKTQATGRLVADRNSSLLTADCRGIDPLRSELIADSYQLFVLG